MYFFIVYIRKKTRNILAHSIIDNKWVFYFGCPSFLVTNVGKNFSANIKHLTKISNVCRLRVEFQ